MTAPAFNRDFKPVYEQVDELSPLIRRVVARNPNPPKRSRSALNYSALD